MNRYVNIARQMDKYTDGQIERYIYEQIGKYTSGNKARWMDKYTDGQIERQINTQVNIQLKYIQMDG